jgi:sensor histidine kinase YesM
MLFKKKLVKLIGSRLFLNCLFWLMIYLIKSPSANLFDNYPAWVYHGLIVYFLFLLAVLSYFHNWFILPNYFFTKRYIVYFVSSIVWLFGVAYFYVFSIKWFSINFPGLEAMRMSVVMSPLTPNLGFASVLKEIQTYFFVMLMWLFIFALLGIYHQTKKTMQSMEALMLLHREAELSFLKSQLNPHFLFNTLNNIYGLALSKNEQTPQVLLKLSSVLRYLLYESNSKFLNSETEKEIMFSYIDLELLRLTSRHQNNFSFYTDKDYEIPPLLWLPILENAFKHTRKLKDPCIDFRFSINNNQLSIISSNRLEPTQNWPVTETSGGIGMQNLTKRLSLLYPSQHHISVSKENGLYQISLNIDLTQHA